MPVGRLLSVFAFEVSPQQVAPFTGGRAEFGCESEHFIFVIAEHHKPAGWNEESGLLSE